MQWQLTPEAQVVPMVTHDSGPHRTGGIAQPMTVAEKMVSV